MMEVDTTTSDRGQKVSQQIFNTPLSIQRYKYVQNYLRNNPDIASVTDFGCGNGRILIWLKSLPHLERYNGIDIDHILLELDQDIYFRPGFYDMMFGRQTTSKPLDIKVYHGDMTIPNVLLHSDCFTLVEVIEHMFPEDVEKTVKTVFGYYQPKLVIVTTPNSEFNHLLRKADEPAKGFRHSDHKFEWNRSQFFEWCESIQNRYNYSVFYDGVGHLPDSQPYGPCTQIAIFKRMYDRNDSKAIDREADHFDLLIEKLNIQDPVMIERNKNRLSLVAEYRVPGLKYDTSHSLDTTPWC